MPKLTRRKKYPKKKRYNKYRNEIREDSQYRCVYCDIHELEMWHHTETRDQRMTLDHFRPKSLYTSLEHDPTNLVLACPTCNKKKSDDWPAYGKPHGGSIDGSAGYVDPFSHDRKDYFEIQSNGELKAKKPPANYMIRVLLLNRPSMKRIRYRRIQLHQNLVALERYFANELLRIENELRTKEDPTVLKKMKMRHTKIKLLRLSLEVITSMIELY